MIFTLIGMPAAGKSSLGKAVAKDTGFCNVDSDRLIEKKVGMKLQNIIDTYGLPEFRRIEEEVLLGINTDKILLSTGGSAVYYPAAMEHLSKMGPVIYLRVGLTELKRRLGDFSKRGIVIPDGYTIDDLFREREALYKRYADFTLDCNGTAFPRYRRNLTEYICRVANIPLPAKKKTPRPDTAHAVSRGSHIKKQ